MIKNNARDDEQELRELGEERVCGEDIFDGVILHVRRDKVKLPGGEVKTRELIRHVGAVCVVPVTDKGEIIVERQFRYPVNKVITEIPAGKLDSLSENRLEAAKRELKEETGIEASEWTCLGDYYSAAAYSDEAVTMYMARGLSYGEQNLDPGEYLNVFSLPLEELVEEIMSGKIADGKTQAAILKAARILGK